MNCELCSKIWSSTKEYEKTLHYPWDEDPAIVIKDGKPYLYAPCEDSYYSKHVTETNYCPKCGRKL
jgi:hypothetical protein